MAYVISYVSKLIPHNEISRALIVFPTEILDPLCLRRVVLLAILSFRGYHKSGESRRVVSTYEIRIDTEAGKEIRL